MARPIEYPQSAWGRILLSGASGHLGANLLRALLERGHRVRVLCHPDHDRSAIEGLDVERVEGDLRAPQTLRGIADDCDSCFHVAAKVSTIDGSAADRREIFETNVLGTRHILALARKAGVKRTVVTGSFSAVGYDIDEPSRPADEKMQFYPFERTMPYERSKVLVEHEVLAAVARGQDAVIATSCAIIGGHDYLPSRMGRTLCDYANGKLRAYIAPGGFEFVTATDIVAGHLLAMERGARGEKYIIASQYCTLDDIMDHFEAVTGIERPALRMPAWLMAAFANTASPLLTRFAPNFNQRLTPGAIRLLRLCRHADTAKARNELGFVPTSIRQAIQEAYAFHYARGAIVNPAAKAPQINRPIGKSAAA
ncbi:MAG: NAD-dependent epimerase/dehydratase family protein [Deltaproteobacteria bacterium]|nr:NAD-dependent epimerase/dehydratase family protein [Deltaproteobacteria bacterium]